MAANPTENLPCSMSTLPADGSLPDTISMPVRILRFFVAYILANFSANAGKPLQTILGITEVKRNNTMLLYSSSSSEAAQANDDSVSMQLLNAFRLRAGNAAVPPAMEAENQLPAPVRRAVHSLRSLLPTLKLASFLANCTNSTASACSVMCHVLIDMKDDLALALQSFAHHTEDTATAAADLLQTPPSSNPAVATAKRDICSWSQLAIGLLLSILRWAIKELSSEASPAAPGVCSLVALSSLLLTNVFLHEGQPQARSAVGQAMFTAGAHSICMRDRFIVRCIWKEIIRCIIRVSVQVSCHCMPVCFAYS